MCEAGVESVKLPFESHVPYASYQLAQNVFSFLGIYFIGGKIEKLINAPVRAFSQQTQANFLHEIKVICQIDDQERILSKDIGTRPWEIQSKLRFKINVLSNSIFNV